jgi:hypothetical protein
MIEWESGTKRVNLQAACEAFTPPQLIEKLSCHQQLGRAWQKHRHPFQPAL